VVQHTRTSNASSPIFLHTGWRTAGTWLWTHLRENADVLGFYEPLNEALGSISHHDLERFRTDSWASNHPPQERSYYEEFAPFVRRGRRGVDGYRESFALDDWFGDGATAPNGLHAYLAQLVAYATIEQRIGVFKFTRTRGRLPWITHHFPDALHVAVVNNPLDQWCSAWQQAQRHDNPYFLIMPWLILHRNRSSSALAATADALDVAPRALGGGRLQAQYDRALRVIDDITPEASYRACLALWVLETIAALRHGDLVIDIDTLHYDDWYRERLEADLAARTGLHVDFSNFDMSRRTAHRFVSNAFDVERIHGDARTAIATTCGATERERRIAQRAIHLLDRRAAPVPLTLADPAARLQQPA
jgi:hypothetical protein